VRVDQTLAPDDLLLDAHWWHCLGSFDVESGALTVRLTDDADGNVIADAVRLL